MKPPARRVASVWSVWLVREQLPATQAAGRAVADAIVGGHRVWVTQTSHTLHTEATRRAGGFMAVHVLDDDAAIEAGDVVLAGTSAGTFDSIVETALVARARGAVVVSLTQLPFERDARMPSAHPSGRRLSEIADIVVDLGGPFGDGEFDLPDADGREVQVIPSSGVTGVLALWMIFAEALDLLVSRGTPPLVWQSNLIDGARERNSALVGEYERTRTGYR
jgi:uncharacterized phosphosugar-binding protein